MARSHLTLAALATSAVPELDVAGAQPFGAPGGEFDAALLTGRDGRHWIIRVPRDDAAEREQSADLVALRAFSAGVRARLPFTVSTFAGQTPVDGTRAVVSEFVYGSKITGSPPSPELAASIGEAIAAIHSLPTTVATDAGLPTHSAAETVRATVALVERASATGLVPPTLLARWERALEESAIWQFTPVLINGAIATDSFLVAGDRVTGVLGWHSMRVGDPARDLQWLARARPELADGVVSAYTRVRGSVDRHLRQRAALLSELEVARWLLHGTEQRSTDVVDDAVQMMSRLVDDVQQDLMDPITRDTMPVLAVDEVERLLDRTESRAR